MAAGSMAEASDSVAKVCPLLTLSAFNPSQNRRPSLKRGLGRRIFFVLTTRRTERIEKSSSSCAGSHYGFLGS